MGRVYTQQAPDGTKVSALRYKGGFLNYGDHNLTLFKKDANNAAWGEYRFSGFASQVQDSVAVSNWDGENFSTVYMVPNRSTVELDVLNAEGRLWFRVQYIFTGASGGTAAFEFASMEEFGYAEGQLHVRATKNGVRETDWWLSNSRLSGKSFNDGTYVEFTRDLLGRDTFVRNWYIDASGEYPAQGTLFTHKTFDASNRALTEKVSDSANSGDPGLLTTRVFSQSGLLKSETNPSGLTTSHVYTNGGRTVTTTLPGGTTQTTDRYLDGSTKSISGTAVVHTTMTATVNGDGTVTRTTYVGPAGTGSPRWTKVTTDWAGRTIKEERPAPPNASPATLTKQYFFNSIGQLTKSTETGLADTLITYNAWNQPFRSGLDINANGTLDTASMDRITETDTIFEKDGSAAWWVKTTTKTYNQDNNGTPVTSSVSKTRVNKYDDHGMHFGNYVQSETHQTDIFGNTTKRTLAVQRGSSYFETNIRLVTETIDYPDSTVDEVKVSRNGLLQKVQSKQGLVYRTYYDSLRRPTKTTDPRTDPNPTPARVGYHTTGTGQTGQIAWQEDSAGNRTNFAYYSADGRLNTETNPLGKATHHAYNLRGQPTRTWGAATYPVEYAYNDYGERVTMSTFRGGSGWDGATWPGSTGTADTTTWAYDPASGTLTSKTDASSRTVAYTYTARGQLKTRTWARNVTTTYNYSATTAELLGVDYSDTTPDLTYTYNRLGQTATVVDTTGTRTFHYSTANTLLTQEDLGPFVGTRSVSHQYDSLGRVNYLGIGLTSSPGGEYNFTYGYDTFGRMNQVWTFTYSYLANSNLIASISDSQTSWTQTRTYESNRNLLDVFETKWSAASKAKFDYTNDVLGRRTVVNKTGEMYSRYSTNGLDTHWGYNDRSELVSEQSRLGGTSTVLTGRDDAYSFDNLGNRNSKTHNGAVSSYTTNALNQYTQRAVPGTIDVSGLAPAAATVEVNSSSSGITRHNDWYFRGYGVNNSSSAVWQSLTISSTFGGSENRTAFVPLTPEPFTYDLDGNLLSDGRWDYVYDAENRLISMQTRGTVVGTIPNASARRLEFRYDYLGRRVQKTVLGGFNGTTYTSTVKDLKFLYNGWDMLYELSVSGGTLTRTHAYIWGLDLSGSRQGAGGVGGLLHAREIATGNAFRFAYDGNGNIHQALSTTDGSVAAAYEYDAFGNTLRETGTYAASNSFRFATKYADTETGLVQHNLRYYSPSLGRFVNRDPIEERGGLNLYAYITNRTPNRWDYLGLHTVDPLELFARDSVNRETERLVGTYLRFVTTGVALSSVTAVGVVAAPFTGPTVSAVGSLGLRGLLVYKNGIETTVLLGAWGGARLATMGYRTAQSAAIVVQTAGPVAVRQGMAGSAIIGFMNQQFGVDPTQGADDLMFNVFGGAYVAGQIMGQLKDAVVANYFGSSPNRTYESPTGFNGNPGVDLGTLSIAAGSVPSISLGARTGTASPGNVAGGEAVVNMEPFVVNATRLPPVGGIDIGTDGGLLPSGSSATYNYITNPPDYVTRSLVGSMYFAHATHGINDRNLSPDEAQRMHDRAVAGALRARNELGALESALASGMPPGMLPNMLWAAWTSFRSGDLHGAAAAVRAYEAAQQVAAVRARNED